MAATHSSPNFVEKYSLMWGPDGRAVQLDNDFERRVRKEASLRSSVESETSSTLRPRMRAHKFSRSASARTAASTSSHRFPRSMSACTSASVANSSAVPSSTSSPRASAMWTPASSWRARSDVDAELERMQTAPPKPKATPTPSLHRATQPKRKSKTFAKKVRDAGGVCFKMVAIPAVIIFDMVDSIVGGR